MSDPRPVGPDDRPVPETLLDEAAIRECVERLAAEIDARGHLVEDEVDAVGP